MRIAQIGNTSGIGTALSLEQVKKGLETKVFVFSDVTEQMFGGIKINYNSFIEKSLFYARLRFYDIWHYHSPFGSLYTYLQKNFKKKIFLKHYHGSDIRNSGNNDSDFCLVSTPDLLKFTPNGKWLPNPIDLNLIKKFRNSKNDNSSSPLLVAHYPYYRNKLEWKFIHRMLKEFESQHNIRIIEIFNMDNKQALEAISKCDIVLGKVIPEIGWFGKFELEGMAIGKPVIAYVSDDLFEKFNPPIFRTTQQTFKEDLADLVYDESVRRKLSREGVEYIERHHDSEIVSEKVFEYYKLIKNNKIN